MPPVMGAVAFVMCELIGTEYRAVIVAALIPSVLYYFGMLLQVDCFAATHRLRGIPREEIPPLGKTLAQGWPFIAVLLFLVWGLLYMRWEGLAPFYASGLMLVLSFLRKATMMTPKRMLDTLASAGTMITQSLAIILPIGFVVCGLSITGVSASFTSGLVALARGNVFLMLVIGAIACYILGMAGMLTPAYIFLAVSLAPAVIKLGNLNVLAVHLFIIYYAMLSAFTPPVAGGAFVAAAMAGANPMKTAVTAMRLGVVLYFVPFFFVFNPALVLQTGSLLETSYFFVLCAIGIFFVAAGIEGYLLGIGIVKSWARPILIISGLLIGFPESVTTVIGATLALSTTAILWTMKRRGESRLVSGLPP